MIGTPDDAPPAVEAETPEGVSTRFGFVVGLARRFEFDRSVFDALAARAWQTLSGPVTVWLIAHFFDAKLQGYYYTFGSLLSFQTFFELNLTVVLLNAAAHEWDRLELDRDGRIRGDATSLGRLAGLHRFGQTWYSAVATVVWAAIGGTGLWLFRGLPPSGLGAWGAAVSAVALTLICLPRSTILLGCHQFPTVNRIGLAQTVTSSLLVWGVIASGAGLWSVAAAWGSKLFWDLWLVRGRYRNFFGSLAGADPSPVRWRSEIWPQQWRLAVQAVVTTGVFSSFTLALFRLRSPEEAGRMGMTWSLMSMLAWSGLAWMQTRFPQLVGLARRRDAAGFDALFVRLTAATTFAVGLGALGFAAALLAMRWIGIGIAGRFVDPTSLSILCVGIVAQHVLNCVTTYSRCRGREAFFWPNVLLNGCTALAVWAVAAGGGQFGVAAVYGGFTIAFGLPMWAATWRRERAIWHEEAALASEGSTPSRP